MFVHRLWIALLVVSLAVGGCARAAANAGGGPSPGATGPLLAFTATTLDGEPFDGMSPCRRAN